MRAMTPRRSRRRLDRILAVVVAGVLAASGAFAQSPASAAAGPRIAAASVAPEEGVRWQGLTPRQREVLAPLEHEWPTMDTAGKQKWITIAARFHTLAPQEQNRISQRMTEWSRLTPVERGEVRMRYQEARQVPAPDRSARWEAYQKLPPAEKQQFLARATASAPGASGARKTAAPHDASQAKANVVPNPALAQPPRPVSPTMVQASPGATTRLITRPTVPPAHQQTGMPKIAATPEFVNRSTLLPRRGPQAAAVGPIGTPAPGQGTPQTARPAPVRPAVLPASAPASNPSR